MRIPFENLIGVPFALGFAALGRWTQLHPEKIVSKGHFTGQDTFGARLFRAQVAFVGTFVVFAGSMGAVIMTLQLLTFGSETLENIALLLGLAAGVGAAVHVRKEVKARPIYVSDSPYGWWP